jgi:hypothetical protein
MDELNQDGVIETMILFKLVALLHRDLLAQNGKAGIARQDAGEGKRHKHNPEKHREDQ